MLTLYMFIWYLHYGGHFYIASTYTTQIKHQRYVTLLEKEMNKERKGK
jgi:hypothetical protein